MSEIKIEIIKSTKLKIILPLVKALNPSISKPLLEARLKEMIKQGYRCIGVFKKDKLIGIAGIWIQTRFYCGKLIEPDNVYIDPKFRALGVGKKLMKFLYEYGIAEGCDVSELNCYVNNSPGQKFWVNEGFKILGFHYQRPLQ